MFLSPDSARKEDAATYPGLPLQENHIRVVRLLPGRWTEQIRCELSSANIEVAKYRALSYVWGSQHVTRSIRLDGHAYPVTVNLEDTLRHLRESHKDGLDLWIDALCINQRDGKERTHQVQLMGLIYKKCEECIVYLGNNLEGARPSLTKSPSIRHFETGFPKPSKEINANGQPGVYEIFSFFHDLASINHLHPHSAFDNQVYAAKTVWQHSEDHFQLRLCESLRKFTHAPFTPWWTRIWVIQEVTTPPSVLITYGTISASWDMFAQGAIRYTHHSADCCKDVVQSLPSDQQKVISDICKKIMGIEELRRSTRSSSITHTDPVSLGLLSLLTQFRDRKASDPRDKVYALLSMAWTPPWRPPLTPDYSLSETSVFCKAALESIYTTKSLSIFSTELGRKFRNDLPSWVPDWGAPGGYTYTARAEAISLYNANREKATPMTVRPMKGVALRIRAVRITTVVRHGETMLGDDTTYIQQTLHQWWLLWSDYTSPEQRKLPVQTPVDERFTRLICAGVIHATHAGLSRDVRALQARDASTFGSWIAYSKISPIGKSDVLPVNYRLPFAAQLWKSFLTLWPQHPLSRTLDPLDHRDGYFPTWVRKDIRNVNLLFFPLFNSLNKSDGKSIFRPLDYLHRQQLRPEASWKDLFNEIQRLLRNFYGEDIHRDLNAGKGLIPDLDNSISIATLSRRLIIGEKSLWSSPATGTQYSGLGPAGTIEGDEVFLLTGGKTPFVLRRRNDADDTIPGPKYEIIGDCYLQGWMDGEGEGLALDNWEDITLV